jgi:hypothetical protein
MARRRNQTKPLGDTPFDYVSDTGVSFEAADALRAKNATRSSVTRKGRCEILGAVLFSAVCRQRYQA